MSYEMDIRTVGEESQSGDAIAFRYGDFFDRNKTKVVIVDGGFKDNGRDLVSLVRETYLTERVDLVISTHPDQDHISGLSIVLEELDICELWMHKPWQHSSAITKYLQTGSRGVLTEKQQRSFNGARDLHELASGLGVPIKEPFVGLSTSDGAIQVLGPSITYYEELLSEITDSTKASERAVYGALARLLEKMKRAIKETWDSESLEEPSISDVSPTNNTSTILRVKLEETEFLLTGDAGVPALERAVGDLGPRLDGQLKYLQIPHHGSKRNVGPQILDHILGPVTSDSSGEGESGIIAFVSSAKQGAPKHPSDRVTNAAVRRGAKVLKTAGMNICSHSDDLPTRPGWGPVDPLPFVSEYED